MPRAIVSLARIAQDGFTHRLKVEIAIRDGQFGQNSSEDGFTHRLRVEIATRDGQFGQNSSGWMYAQPESRNDHR